jgi:hypothetical protein
MSTLSDREIARAGAGHLRCTPDKPAAQIVEAACRRGIAEVRAEVERIGEYLQPRPSRCIDEADLDTLAIVHRTLCRFLAWDEVRDAIAFDAILASGAWTAGDFVALADRVDDKGRRRMLLAAAELASETEADWLEDMAESAYHDDVQAVAGAIAARVRRNG